MNITSLAPIALIIFNIQSLSRILIWRMEMPRLLKIRQKPVPTPIRIVALAKVGIPAVIVVLVAAVDLEAVDAGAAAEHEAADDGRRAVVEASLGRGCEGEEVALVGEGTCAAGDCVDGGAVV